VNSPNRHQITLRVSKELDRKLTKLSRDLGVSKNAYILMVLSKELGLMNEQTASSA
jgi:predicted DNA-binding protein